MLLATSRCEPKRSWRARRSEIHRIERTAGLSKLLRKEVIQPQVPLRLPCYDFTPITPHTLGAYLPRRGWPSDFWYTRLSWCDGRCVQGPGTYSPERADLRLLAIPASGRRVAADHPN